MARRKHYNYYDDQFKAIIRLKPTERITLFNTHNKFVTITANPQENGNGVQENEHNPYCDSTDKNPIS